MRITFIGILAALFISGCAIFESDTRRGVRQCDENNMETRVAPSTDLDAPAVFGPAPSERQLAWHKLKYYAFIHFGPNTFTDIEWGHGTESPEVFNPLQLDCRQWAKVIKDAGMEGVIITAKHHDGFCLWPSLHSTHTVRESAWKEGKGDLLMELSQACREFGIRFGVYISPWDRNHPTYGTDEYNQVFKKMLEEVLTRYGEVFEVWFDGACGEGPNGKRQVYDWPGFVDVVRKFQPRAVIFSDSGPDIRWIGNEEGYAAETNWCTVRDKAFYPGIPGRNAQQQTGHEDGDLWLPAEVNTSIRPGWFYHRSEDDKVKPVNRLIDNWYHSVGMNGNFLLNLPVDDRGLIHENDIKALTGLRRHVEEAFSTNLAVDATAIATQCRSGLKTFDASKAIDPDPMTYWATDDHVLKASFVIEFKEPMDINAVMLQEFIALGQRVESFTIEVWKENTFEEAAGGTTIGNRRIVRFDTVKTPKLKINIHARACPCISNIEVYRVP
ncbi:MAG: alpha-L-fucosidase [Planctomycetota bacterium]